MPSSPYKLLIFDWDGTLIDSEASIVMSLQAAIKDVGIAAISVTEIRHIIGLGLYEALTTLLPGQSEKTYAALIARYRHHFFSTAPSEAFPEVKNTLRELHSQGYLLAVATGKGRQGLDLALKSTALQELFVASRCADETQSKPHPQMLHEILAQLDMPVSHALMIGDTSYDLEMANEAGMDSAAVCTGVHEKSHLLNYQPAVCLDAMPGLLAWLQSVPEKEASGK
ncbi:MAG: HAD family hydrolase [Thiohalomonadales bacterium]